MSSYKVLFVPIAFKFNYNQVTWLSYVI